MNYFPIFLDSKYINAIVIGGGEVAARKIELLLKTTTNIAIISKNVSVSVERLIKTHDLKYSACEFSEDMILPYNLVIAATNDPNVNATVALVANRENKLVNVVDQPELCSYITPAIIDRSPMIVALSSSGTSPVLIRMLREQIEKILPSGYGKLAQFSFKFRDHVKARVKELKSRRVFWERTLRGSIGRDVMSGNIRQAEQELIVSLKSPQVDCQGEIVFIHTLEGDPDKLTLAAHRDLQFADAVFYDETVNLDLLEYVRRDAEKYPQQVFSSILINYQHAIELAEAGNKVIYLLSGQHVLPQNTALNASQIQITEHISGQ